MFQKLKRLFSLEQNKESEEQAYIEYDSEKINRYREMHPHIDMDEIRIPDMSDEGVYQITQWFKKDGDKINKSDTLCKIETKFAIMELESDIEGYLYYRQKPGIELNTGDIVCLILSKKL